MVSFELPTVLSIGKGGKHIMTTMLQLHTNLATTFFPIVTYFGRHFKMSCFELPMVLSVGKGGKHTLTAIWQ